MWSTNMRCLGMPIGSEQDFGSLILGLAPIRTLGAADGQVLRTWMDPSGASLLLGFRDDRLDGLPIPVYAGEPATEMAAIAPVGETSVVLADVLDRGGSVAAQITFDLVGRQLFEPVNGPVCLTAFGYDVRSYPDADAYLASVDCLVARESAGLRPVRSAAEDPASPIEAEWFTSAGMFGPAPGPYAIVAGVVRSSRTHVNEYTGRQFHVAVVSVPRSSISFDLCLDPSRNRCPQPGATVAGTVYLAGVQTEYVRRAGGHGGW